MFEQALDAASKYTRPIHFITRNYGSSHVQPGAGTLFFVNADGWALTCRHVTRTILAGDALAKRYSAFLAEAGPIAGQKGSREKRRTLEKKHGISKDATIELYTQFVDCIEGPLNCDIKEHPDLDVALLHFKGYTKLRCDTFPVFPSDGESLPPGRFLCRLGYPFPEFTNFEYDEVAEKVKWTNAQTRAPRFPIEGMLTRHLGTSAGSIWGFEMSTPGLKGQSGGPAVAADGRVWGMQSATNHLDLDFDVDQDVIRNGAKKRVRDSAFLHVGHCIHADVLKAFMRQHGVHFDESPGAA